MIDIIVFYKYISKGKLQRGEKNLFKTKNNAVRRAEAHSLVMNTLRLSNQRKGHQEILHLGAWGAKTKLILYEACKVYEKYYDIKGFKCGMWNIELKDP